jgi:hypothetical protein
MYDRALLLSGAKRDDVLTLQEVQQYGIDSFSDADYVSIYGMPPAEWYGRGIRLLGRTAVECTRDALSERMGRDIATVVAKWPTKTRFVVIDPFAGSCNTLYWILKHVANSEGLAFELDPTIYELSKRNIGYLDRNIALVQGDYKTLLGVHRAHDDRDVIVFVAPPWGDAWDGVGEVDLRRTAPPVEEVISHVARTYVGRRILFATQVYEKVHPESLADLQRILEWSEVRIYDINVEGRNHGLLLGTRGWKPSSSMA